MKKIQFFAGLFLLFQFSACTVTENISFHADGSGNFSLDMDASELMAMVPNDSLKKEQNNQDIDSTFTFKQLLAEKKDSISKLPLADQAKLKKLEDYTMKMKMSAAQKQFFFSINREFKNVSELQDGMDVMNEVQRLGNPQKGMPAGGLSNNSSVAYALTDKKFTRKAVLDKKAASAIDASDDGYKMIYESSNYIVTYHFPKRVKKVSNENAIFTEDRKTITIEYPFIDYLQNPDKLNFEVEFE